VQGRSHLETLVGYLARQPVKHGLVAPAATYAGSCLQDLGRARVVEGFDPARIAEALPRFDAFGAALSAIGWRGNRLDQADDAAIAALAPAELWAAVAAAACVDSSARSKEPANVAARIAYVHLSRRVGRSWDGAVAEVLGERTWYRLAAAPAPAVLVAAVRRRVTLEGLAARAVRASAPKTPGVAVTPPAGAGAAR
jgi:hypothetical protein